MFHICGIGISYVKGIGPGLTGSCHGLHSESALISSHTNILDCPRTEYWVEGIKLRCVLIIPPSLRK